MNWLSLLGNVASGGLFGLVGQLATGFLHLRERAQENAHELAMIEARKGLAVEAASATAFAESQRAEAATNGNTVPPWAAAVKTLWRPFLSLLLLTLTWRIYETATPEVRDRISGDLVTVTSACVFWWFGSRYQAALREASPVTLRSPLTPAPSRKP